MEKIKKKVDIKKSINNWKKKCCLLIHMPEDQSTTEHQFCTWVWFFGGGWDNKIGFEAISHRSEESPRSDRIINFGPLFESGKEGGKKKTP